jgi:hypothetical protein
MSSSYKDTKCIQILATLDRGHLFVSLAIGQNLIEWTNFMVTFYEKKTVKTRKFAFPSTIS